MGRGKTWRINLFNPNGYLSPSLGGARGQASDIAIVAENILRTKKKLNTIMGNNSGHTVEEMEKATDRDNWLTAEEAKAFGLIDEIVEHR